jgi:hypothetical protein
MNENRYLKSISNLDINNTLFEAAPHFCGTYSCNNIPKDIAKLSIFSIICNIDKVGEIGSHFITIIGRSKRIMYIDPLAYPCTNKYIAKFLKKAQQYNNRKLEIQNVPIQHPISTYCGYFCMVFVLFFEKDNHGIKLKFNKHKLLLNDIKCIKYLVQFLKI